MGKPFGGMKQTGGGGAGAKSATTGFENFLSQGINQGVFGGGNFGDAINQMLQGRAGDPNNFGQYFDQVNNGNTGGMLPGQLNIGSSFAPPQYQGFNPMGGEFQAPQFQQFNPQQPGVIDGSFNAPQFQAASLQGFDPNQFGASVNKLNNNFGTTAQLGSAGSADVDGEYGQAVRSILGREQEKQVGDMRARFGATGSGLGSNAQYAESNFRAENTPRIAAALGDINMQERGLNLQQRGQDLQNFYSGRGADVSQLNAMTTQGGLGLQGVLGLNGQNLQQMGMLNNFNQGNAQFGAAQGMQAQGMNMNALMQMNQMGQNQNQFMNQFNQGNAQFGAQNQMQMNQLMQNQNQFMNSFGQNNAQFGAGQQQQADMFNVNAQMQNQGMMNNWAMNRAQLGMGQQQMAAQQQQAGIQALMQMLMQNQGLNTSQRQQVYQPGWVQQGLGAAGQITGIAGMFANPLKGMTGGGAAAGPQVSLTPSYGSQGFGGGWQMPNIPMPVSYGGR